MEMKMRIAKRLLATILMIYTLDSSASTCKAEDVVQAQKSAEVWLEFWDAGEVQKSWEEASVSFKADVTAIYAKKIYNDLRHPLGLIKKRKFQSSKCDKGAYGEHIDIVFTSQFTSKAWAIETVELVREKNGTWKTSSWLIR